MNINSNVVYAIDPETVYPEVEKIIFKLAWDFANKYPVTFEDARSVAYLAFMKSCIDYKPDRKTKFSTWCYYWVWTELKTWITKRSKDPLLFLEMDDDLCGETKPVASDHMDLIADLGEDAKEMVRLFTETPAELVGMSMTTSQFVKRVKDHMVAKGRDRKSVDATFNTLQSHFQAAWA